jgi:hypothetical protein
MDLEKAGATVKHLIRDRDANIPPLFDEILAQAGIHIVLSGIRMPRMNSGTSITCCTPCTSTKRTTTATALTKRYTRPRHYAQCPHRALTNSTSPTSPSADTTDSAASSTSTNMQPDQAGRHYRQVHLHHAKAQSEKCRWSTRTETRSSMP